MIIDELPKVKVPVLVRLPPNVIGLFPELKVPPLTKLPPTLNVPLRFKVEPVFMVSGTPQLSILLPIVIAPVLAIIIPPVAVKGVIHSTPTVLDVLVLYFNVAEGP